MAYNKNERYAGNPGGAQNPSEIIKGKQSGTGNRRGVGGCLLIVLFAISFSAAIFWLVWSVLRAEDSFRFEAKSLVTEVDGIPYLVSVTGYFKAFKVEKSGASTRRSGSTNYFLTVWELPAGRLVKKVKLESKLERLYTIHLGLWSANKGYLTMLAGAPRRFSLPNLETSEVNNQAGEGLLPTEERYYTFDPKNEVVWIDLLNGEKAWLDTKNGQIRALPHPDAPVQPEPDEMREYYRNMSAAFKAPTDYIGWNFSPEKNKMLCLAPDNREITSFSKGKMENYSYRENERLFPFSMNYNYSANGDFIEPDVQSVTKLERSGFLQGGFLKNERGDGIFTVEGDVVILHRSLIGNTGLLQATRMGMDGRKKWTMDVFPVNELKQILLHEDNIIFVGTGEKQDSRNDLITVINTVTGKTETFQVKF